MNISKIVRTQKCKTVVAKLQKKFQSLTNLFTQAH